MNWTCTQCSANNAPDDDFCLGCGAAKSANATAAPAPASTLTPAGPAIRTLVFGGNNIPLAPGTFTIAWSGANPKPDLGLDSDKVSSTPLVLTVAPDGKVTAAYASTEEKSWSVIKNLKPKQPMEIVPGETIIAGESDLLMLL